MHLCFFVVLKVLGAHEWLTSGGRLGRKWRLIRSRREAGTLRSTAAPQRACSNFSYLRLLVETRACPCATPSEDRPVEPQQALDYVDRPAPTRSACLHFLKTIEQLRQIETDFIALKPVAGWCSLPKPSQQYHTESNLFIFLIYGHHHLTQAPIRKVLE